MSKMTKDELAKLLDEKLTGLASRQDLEAARRGLRQELAAFRDSTDLNTFDISSFSLPQFLLDSLQVFLIMLRVMLHHPGGSR